MATSYKTALFCFLISVLFACIVPWIANIQFHYIAAPLVMLMYNTTLLQTLWFACLGGLLVDGLTLSPRLGFLALSYLISCRLLYHCRLYFFKDSKMTLAAMTFLFSLVTGIVGMVIALFFNIPLASIRLSDLFVRPIEDMLYAFVVFELSSILWLQYRLQLRRKRKSS